MARADRGRLQTRGSGISFIPGPWRERRRTAATRGRRRTCRRQTRSSTRHCPGAHDGDGRACGGAGSLREDHARVKRHPTDRPLAPGEDPFKERTVEVRETAEEPVISKKARVVGEVEVGKESTERLETVGDTVRRSHVEVEPATGAPSSNASRYDDAAYRADFKQRFGAPGSQYEEYE